MYPTPKSHKRRASSLSRSRSPTTPSKRPRNAAAASGPAGEHGPARTTPRKRESAEQLNSLSDIGRESYSATSASTADESELWRTPRQRQATPGPSRPRERVEEWRESVHDHARRDHGRRDQRREWDANDEREWDCARRARRKENATDGRHHVNRDRREPRETIVLDSDSEDDVVAATPPRKPAPIVHVVEDNSEDEKPAPSHWRLKVGDRAMLKLGKRPLLKLIDLMNVGITTFLTDQSRGIWGGGFREVARNIGLDPHDPEVRRAIEQAVNMLRKRAKREQAAHARDLYERYSKW